MAKLNAEALGKIDLIVSKHKNQAGPCIEMLHEVQDSLGYIHGEDCGGHRHQRSRSLRSCHVLFAVYDRA